jgi:eukaryotic translation initiation factor 2C
MSERRGRGDRPQNTSGYRDNRPHSGGYRGASNRDGPERGGGRGRGRESNETLAPMRPNLDHIKISTIAATELHPPKQIHFDTNIAKAAPGKEGTAVKLLANYFPLSLPEGPFYQYAVHINVSS